MGLAYYFMRGALTTYHRLGGLDSRNSLLPSSEGWKFQIVSMVGSFWGPWKKDLFQISLLGLSMDVLSLCPYTISLFLSVFKSIVFMRTWFSYWIGVLPNNFGLPCDSAVKNLPAVKEMWVPSLTWGVPLEEEMATYSSTLSGKSHGQRSLVGYSPLDRRVRHDWMTEHI